MKAKKRHENASAAGKAPEAPKMEHPAEPSGGYSTNIPGDLLNDLNKIGEDSGLELAIEPPTVSVEEEAEPGGPDAAALLAEARAEIERLTAENGSLAEKSLRIAAEYENYRKRTSREREELQKYAAESLLRDLIPVADNMENALEHMGKTGNLDTLKTGVEMTYKSFLGVLKNKGVTPFDSIGKHFDPNLHEAIQTMPSDTVPAGDVCGVIRRGYLLNNRLLRPSMVIVSTGPAVKGEVKDENCNGGAENDESAP